MARRLLGPHDTLSCVLITYIYALSPWVFVPWAFGPLSLGPLFLGLSDVLIRQSPHACIAIISYVIDPDQRCLEASKLILINHTVPLSLSSKITQCNSGAVCVHHSLVK